MKKGNFLTSAATVALFMGLSSTQAAAQDAAAPQDATDSSALEEIVVTAQHRTESAQSVPVSISVVSGAALENSGYQSITDLQRIVPSVQYDPNGGGGFQIRGVGTQVYDYSTEQAVGVVVDDVVMDLPRNPGIAGLTAVSQVDVLRGPQGTLFGKNATAGVIFVTTRKPTFDKVSIDGGAEYGERNDYRFYATLNAPLSDTVGVLVSGIANGQDGAARNRLLNKPMETYKDAAIRGKLRYAPNDSLDIIVSGDYAHHYDNNPILGTARGGVSPAQLAQATALGIKIGPNNIDAGLDQDYYNDYTIAGGSLVAKYQISGHTITSISAYRSMTGAGNNPLDQLVTKPNFIVDNLGTIDAHKFSQELRLTSEANLPVSYSVGLFYNNVITNSTQTQAGNFYGSQPAGTYLSTCNGQCNFRNHSTSVAMYGQATVKLSDQFGIDLGGRLTHEKNQQSLRYSIPADLGYAVIGINPVPANPTGEVTATRFTYKISPTFKPSKDITIFATYATGYKGPGVAYVSGIEQHYKMETVDSFEAGFKSELFDRHLRLNVSGFYSKYKNFQAQDIQFVNGGPVFLIINAGGLKTKGVEAEFTVRPSKIFSISGGVTYSDSFFTDYVKSGVQYAGSQLTNAPKWTYQIGLDMNLPVSDKFVFDFNASYNHRSSTYFLVGDATSIQNPYGVINLRAGFGPENGQWKVGVYARNLGDQSFSSGQNNVPTGLLRIDTPAAHRTVGGFLRFSF